MSRVTIDPAFDHIHEPGGFRRNYLLLKANQEGAEQPQMLKNFVDFLFIFGHFVRTLSPFLMIHTLILFCYNQAGEDLEEDEEGDESLDDDHTQDDDLLDNTLPGPSNIERGLIRGRDLARRPIKVVTDLSHEQAPLLARSISAISPTVSRKIDRARRRRRSSVGPHGDATVPQAILMVRRHIHSFSSRC